MNDSVIQFVALSLVGAIFVWSGCWKLTNVGGNSAAVSFSLRYGRLSWRAWKQAVPVLGCIEIGLAFFAMFGRVEALYIMAAVLVGGLVLTRPTRQRGGCGCLPGEPNLMEVRARNAGMLLLSVVAVGTAASVNQRVEFGCAIAGLGLVGYGIHSSLSVLGHQLRALRVSLIWGRSSPS